MIVGIIGLVVVPNTLCFLLFVRDMRSRGERRRRWYPRFLLLGPMAVAWYCSVRALKDGETRPGEALYNLSRSFILPWTIYMAVMPVIVWGTMTALDLADGVAAMSTAEFVLTALFWLPVFYLISMAVVVPVWAAGAIAAGLVLLVKRP